jgi:hypothetical protein
MQFPGGGDDQLSYSYFLPGNPQKFAPTVYSNASVYSPADNVFMNAVATSNKLSQPGITSDILQGQFTLPVADSASLPDIQASWLDASDIPLGLTIIGNVTSVTVGNTAPPQVVFLDFGADANAVLELDAPLGATITAKYLKPDANPSPELVKEYVAFENSEYSKYNVIFTSTRPQQGSYQTIYIGGTIQNVYNSNPLNAVLIKAVFALSGADPNSVLGPCRKY